MSYRIHWLELGLILGACHGSPEAPLPQAPPSVHVAEVAPAPTGPSSVPPPPAASAMTPEQAAHLAKWYAALGAPARGETFGELVVRAGMVQLGKPYLDAPAHDPQETLDLRLDTFQCVSFVESTLAVARCLWLSEPTATCFARQVESHRYRDGKIAGYATRLHYFADWLTDNQRRGNVATIEHLPARPWPAQFSFITGHLARFPALRDPSVRDAMAATERDLNSRVHHVVPKGDAARALGRLRAGDVIAIVTDKPGLLIGHTGFAAPAADGGPVRLLHASSYHRRVLLTGIDLAGYLRQRPTRVGFMATRPQVPVAGRAD